MNTIETHRIIVGDKTVEVWESPDAAFDATNRALRRYANSGEWIALFNALTLRTAPLWAE